MIYVGLDDTDTLDDPGTNQLARHIVRELAAEYNGRLIIRHQLLEDPRVPCTRKNGCASILMEYRESHHQADGGHRETQPTLLIERLRHLIIPWCPQGSDPGLCVATSVPQVVQEWGVRCQRELVTQQEARQIAAAYGIYLEGLGGTEDGVIGALAAIGLMATQNDGRVVHSGSEGQDLYDITGVLSADTILTRGVDEIRVFETNEAVTAGTIEVGKRLRPNFRNGRVVLFVARPMEETTHNWDAVRIT